MDNKEDDGTTTRIMGTNKDNTQGQKTIMRTMDNGQLEDDGRQLG